MIRPRKKPVNPAGEYTFTHKGKEYSLSGHWINDPTSPDGMRWIATSHAKTTLNRIVYELAGSHCEMQKVSNCWRWVPYGCGTHHVITKKMGGAFTDDRIWRNGERIRVLSCPSCHRNHHNRLHWSSKRTA